MDPRIAARRRNVQETRARRNVRRLIALMFVGATLGGAYWILRSPLLDVDEIEVMGAERAGVEQIIAETGVREGVPIVDIDVVDVEQALLSDPWIKSAIVDKAWSGSVVIEVEERIETAWVKTSDGGATAAADGTVLAESTEPIPGLPVLEARDRTTDALGSDLAVRDSLEFVAALSDQVRPSVHMVLEGNQLEGVAAGYILRVGRPDEPVSKAQAVMAVIATGPEPHSVITVFSPNRPAVLAPGAQPDISSPLGDEPTGEGDGSSD